MMWLIRFSVIVPIGLLVLVTSYSIDFDRYRDLTMSFTMILFSIGILLMTIITPKPVDFAHYAKLMGKCFSQKIFFSNYFGIYQENFREKDAKEC